MIPVTLILTIRKALVTHLSHRDFRFRILCNPGCLFICVELGFRLPWTKVHSVYNGVC